MNVYKIFIAISFFICHINLNGQFTLVNLGSMWNYYDSQNEPASQGSLDWYDISYDDGLWSAGAAELGYGDGDESTAINSNTLTAYFRHDFIIADSSIYDGLTLNLTYDDGAVIYLNGAEVWRVNMPLGNINYNTFASSTSSDNAQDSTSIANYLITGVNTLAVEVHQRSSVSSDISFNLKLEGAFVSVIRGPYLQIGGSSIMTIKWRTGVVTESIINYGTSLGSLSGIKSDLTAKTEHELEITGLSPNTEYYYQIANSTDTLVPSSSDLYFKTAPVIGTSQSLNAWILGDCGTGNSDARSVRDAYYNYIGANHTDMILFLGDNAYQDGTDNEYQFALFENMYEDKLKNTVSYSCLGNHDGHSADSDSQTGPYYDIFSLPSSGQLGGIASNTEAYYSFDFGNIHFVVLDSYETDRGVNKPMYNWCRSDLQNTSADWIIGIWHHPPYSKGSHNSDSETQLVQMRQNFLPMLDSNGVDLVLSGHSHSMERSYLLYGHYGLANTFIANTHTIGMAGDGDGKDDVDGVYIKETSGVDAGRGTVYITTGSAGKTFSDSLNHPAMFYSQSLLGSCVLEISGNQLHVKFIRSNEVIDDYFTITKNGLALPVELISFDAEYQQNNTLLTWSTSSETYNSHFIIEASSDTKNWKNIGEVKGAGSSSERIDYTFVHQNVQAYASSGLLYYRLRQVDFSGEFTFSVVRVVDLSIEALAQETNIFPNPSINSSALNIEYEDLHSLEVYAMTGQLIIYKKYDSKESENIQLDISQLSPGTYYLVMNGIQKERLIISQ